jgi:hypothetical protein
MFGRQGNILTDMRNLVIRCGFFKKNTRPRAWHVKPANTKQVWDRTSAPHATPRTSLQKPGKTQAPRASSALQINMNQGERSACRVTGSCRHPWGVQMFWIANAMRGIQWQKMNPLNNFQSQLGLLNRVIFHRLLRMPQRIRGID